MYAPAAILIVMVGAFEALVAFTGLTDECGADCMVAAAAWLQLVVISVSAFVAWKAWMHQHKETTGVAQAASVLLGEKLKKLHILAHNAAVDYDWVSNNPGPIFEDESGEILENRRQDVVAFFDRGELSLYREVLAAVEQNSAAIPEPARRRCYDVVSRWEMVLRRFGQDWGDLVDTGAAENVVNDFLYISELAGEAESELRNIEKALARSL